MRAIRIPEVKRGRALRRATTSAERKVCAGSRNRALGGHKFVRQERIGPYYTDFACREARLIVEIDGATHSTDRELAYDKAREEFLRSHGYRIVRFTNGEVYEQADSVFDAILAALAEGSA
jgi:very-short-patch-repair endonuclease